MEAELGIERRHAKNRVFGNLQKARGLVDRILRNIAIFFLNCLKQGDQFIGCTRETSKDQIEFISSHNHPFSHRCTFGTYPWLWAYQPVITPDSKWPAIHDPIR